MIKTTLILILLLPFVNIQAQSVSSEFGIIAGVSYYLGDVNHSKQFYSPEPSYGFAFRTNTNDRYSIRIDAVKATLSGNDADFDNGYQQTRGHLFVNNIYEVSSHAEFNFLPYDSRSRNVYSPYITAGIAILITPKENKTMTLSIPMGAGIKFAFSKRMTVGAEWIFRKTKTDYLDLLDATNNNTGTSKQITRSFNNNDWYATAGIVISYQFSGGTKWCSAYSNNRRNGF